MAKRIFICISLIYFVHQIDAQQINVNGFFVNDSIQIGVPSPYVLYVSYPDSLNVIFPDSLYSFDKFELYDKQYFSTRTIDNVSLDSAVYFLTTFEIDSIQYLNLPIYQLLDNDSISYRPPTDSIILQHLVENIPDSLTSKTIPLLENTSYQEVAFDINYFYILIAILVIILLIVISFYLFKKSIKKWFTIKRLKKIYKKFDDRFNKVANTKELDFEDVEKMMSIWKSFHERLEKNAFTKMTTKEILAYNHFNKIKTELHLIDKTLYGRKTMIDSSVIKNIHRFSTNIFLDLIDKIKYE